MMSDPGAGRYFCSFESTIYNLSLLVQPFLPKTSVVIQHFFGSNSVN